jgi:hypothetical protein
LFVTFYDAMDIRASAARRIARFIRNIRPRNSECSLTLDLLRPPIFRYYPQHNYKQRPIGYSLSAILDYIQVGKRLMDPCTREMYNDDDLRRMDVLIHAYRLHNESPFHTRMCEIRSLESSVACTFESVLRPSDDVLYDVLRNMLRSPFTRLTDDLMVLRRIDRQRALDVALRMRATVQQGYDTSRIQEFVEQNLPSIVCGMVHCIYSMIKEEN